MSLQTQIIWLFLLALPVACIAWTVTHEEIFRELQEYCRKRAENARSIWVRKFFYPLQCEYCLSHYVATLALAVTRYKLLFDDWRGYVIAGFALVWIANQYLSIYARLRLDIRRERVEIKGVEAEVKQKVEEIKQDAPKRAA